MVRGCHSTSPEIRDCSEPFTRKASQSLFGSLETFHQKLNVPGPFTVVSNVVAWLCVIGPLRPASMPSSDTRGWPIQAADPLVSQIQLVASSASGSGTAGVTVNV